MRCVVSLVRENGNMKTNPEYRAQALRFAKKNGFETTHFRGIYEDSEVYTAGPCF